MASKYEKEIIDSIYDGGLYTGGVFIIGYGLKKILGVTIPCVKFDAPDIMKLWGYTTSSIVGIDWLKIKGWIPASIAPKK